MEPPHVCQGGDECTVQLCDCPCHPEEDGVVTREEMYVRGDDEDYLMFLDSYYNL